MATDVRETAGGTPEAQAGELRRELRFFEAIALSIAIMAPTAAMALNGTAVAGLIGRAVPLAFIVATLGVLFVSWGFIRLTRLFNSAGSVLTLTGITLGPRAGFFAAWALFGTYLGFTVGSVAEIGVFGEAFFAELGTGSPDWILIALVGGVLVALLSLREVRGVTRSLLGLEGLSVALIVVLVVIIFVKLFAGSAPEGRELTVDVFAPPDGVPFAAVATAAVFGFLSFGGFEGAASLGEETDNPRRNIPRAIGTAVVVAGVFYIIVMIAQALGFGANEAGATRFSESSSPLGDLSNDYVGSWMAVLINFGAMISAFAAGLGAATAASRILFSLARDAFGGGRVAQTSRVGAPAGALAVIMLIAALALVGLRLGGTSAVNAFFYPGTLGVLLLLVTYLLTNVGATRFLFFRGERRAPLVELVFPAVAVVILVYVLYKNTDPGGLEFPYTIFPLIAGAWLLAGLAIVLLSPGAARRIGASLVREEERGSRG